MNLNDLFHHFDKQIKEGQVSLDYNVIPESGVKDFLSILYNKHDKKTLFLKEATVTFKDTIVVLSGMLKGALSIPGVRGSSIRKNKVECRFEQKDNASSLTVDFKIITGQLNLKDEVVLVCGVIEKNILKITALEDNKPRPFPLKQLSTVFDTPMAGGILPYNETFFEKIPLTKFNISYNYDDYTTTQVTYDSTLKENWEITEEFALNDIGIMVEVNYIPIRKIIKDFWFRTIIQEHKIYATLLIKQKPFQVSLSYYNNAVWKLRFYPPKEANGNVFPMFQEVLSWLGAEEFVSSIQSGLASYKITDISLRELNVTVSSAERKVLSVDIEGELKINNSRFICSLGLPDFNVRTRLATDSVISLKSLLTTYINEEASHLFPNVNLTVCDLFIYPNQQEYEINFAIINDGSIELGGLSLGIKSFACNIHKLKQKITGSVAGVVTLGKIDIRLGSVFEFGKQVVFSGLIPEIKLSSLLKDIIGEVSLPKELPEVTFSNLGVEINPMTGDFSIQGATKFVWSINNQSLNFDMELKLSKQGKDTKIPIACALKINARNEITPFDELVFEKLDFEFNLEQNSEWSLKGGGRSRLFERVIEVKAEYEQINEKKLLSLSSILGEEQKNLIELSGIASLKGSTCNIYLERVEQKINCSFKIGGGLALQDICEIAGTIEGYWNEKGAGLALVLSQTSWFTLPLVPQPLAPETITLTVKAPRLMMEKIEGQGWKFKSAATLAIGGLEKYTTITNILPKEITTELVLDKQGLNLSVDSIISIPSFIFPNIVLGETVIELQKFGPASISLGDLSVNISKNPSLSMGFGVGLPPGINKIFGTLDNDDTIPALNLFKTYDPAKADETTVKVKFNLNSSGISFGLKSSPFNAVKINDNKLDCDLGIYGAIQIDLPTFIFKGKSFGAKGGFKITRDLKFPLKPFKKILERANVEKIANMLPDALPLMEIKLFDSQNNLQVESLITMLNTIANQANITFPEALITPLRQLATVANKLPDTLKQYLNFELPRHFSMDISLNADAGVNIDIEVDKERPIKLLYPGMLGIIPTVQGITLKGFSFGTAMGGSLFTLKIDSIFDQFDLVSLVAGLSIPDNDLLPSSREIGRRLIIENLFMLIIYQTGIPIPVPIFYDHLAVQYLGLEGVKFESHVRFPAPSFDLQEIIRLFSSLKKFVKEKDHRLTKEMAPKNMDLVFSLDNIYLKLPKYLGGNLLGKEGEIIRISLMETVFDLMNSVKFFSLNDFIKLVELKYRIGNEKIDFFFLSMQAQWLLTTPKEFSEGSYLALGIKPEQTLEYVSVLPKYDKEEGVVAFVKGVWEIENIAKLDVSLGLVSAGDTFSTGVKFNGFIKEVIQLNLQGNLVVLTNPTLFQIKGNAFLTFANLEVFSSKGEILVDNEKKHFMLSGSFNLFKDENFPFNVQGAISGELNQFGINFVGAVEAKLGPIVLANTNVQILGNQHNPKKGIWLRSQFFGSEIFFSLEDNRDGSLQLDFEAIVASLASITVKQRLDAIKQALTTRVEAQIFNNFYNLKIESDKSTRSESKFNIQHLGFTLAEGECISEPDNFLLKGRFQLFPAGSPLNITANMEGAFRRDSFYFKGNVETISLLPGILAKDGASVDFNQNGVELKVRFLGIETNSMVKHSQLNPGDVSLIFETALGNLSRTTTTLNINSQGTGGSAEIRSNTGYLSFRGDLNLGDHFNGEWDLALGGLSLLRGNLRITADGLVLNGRLQLPSIPYFSLDAGVTGSIGPYGLVFGGESKFSIGMWVAGSWVGVEGFGYLNHTDQGITTNFSAQGKVGLVHLPPIGIATSIRIWNGQLCFMASWRLAPLIPIPGKVGNIHQLVVPLNGGTPQLDIFWWSWREDWPHDIRASDIPSPGISGDSGFAN
jgi:hypothetical protein